ncbi:MAG: hypothetical protein H7062_15705 [Candidatus Saccharimonas sp.]|nr:hypothetical protein [Planctomycetaceae bacterium]
MKYQIKQLGLGGILDQAISLLKNHFGLLFGIVAMTIIPFMSILGLVQVSIMAGGDLQTGMIIGLIGNLFFIYVLTPLVNAAVIHAVASAYLSRPTTLGQCFSHASQRFLALLGTSILMGLAIVGGVLLCVVPGILFALWFMLAQHVAVLEGSSGSAALGRSKALMQGNVGTGFVLGLVILIINFGIVLGAGIIPQPHTRVVAVALAQGIGTLLATCSFVVFYFSCRCKAENFDLQVLADAVSTDADVQPVE